MEETRLDIEELYFWMSGLIECGFVSLQRYLDFCGDIHRAFDYPARYFEQMDFLSDKNKETILKSRDILRIKSEYKSLHNRGITYISRCHEDFPEKLLYIYNCPFGLFYMGCLPEPMSPAVAIVGARGASPYGQEMARSIARDLALAGVAVISGLALGIDGFAHRGALEAGKRTYGILGCGVNICYPKENMEVFEAMKSCGGILSEYPPGAQPLHWHFPFRNRIISGMSDGILVVEARKKSGSLITVGMGLDQGKDIFAVPGRPVDVLSEGCNSLINDGAKIVTCARDILEEYEIFIKDHQKNNIVLDNLEDLVYSSLCLDAESIEMIARKAKLAYPLTAKLLFSLERKGFARQVGKNYYIRKL